MRVPQRVPKPHCQGNHKISQFEPSNAAKGHMKQPRKGIRSTRHLQRDLAPPMIIPINDVSVIINDASNDVSEDSTLFVCPAKNIIESDNDADTNVFIFGVFADKQMVTLYSDLTGTFPFMSLEGNVWFLIVYHYKSNAIWALPIANFADETILAAFQQQFELLESQGHKIKLNVMNNQASRAIKKYLTKQQCNDLLVEPNNHQVNAAERAIQTFKAHFISALAMTDSNFPLQLWDCLTPQVEATLNMLRPSWINPTMLAYKAIYGPYDWNRFPLALLGCKAIIYEAPELHGLWASHGTDVWYVGPSLNHYRCNHFFVPETRAYWMSGSAELFPQHCQVPYLMWNEHLQEVINKLVTTLHELPPKKRIRIMSRITAKLSAPLVGAEPRQLTYPGHEWLLPRADVQLNLYVPPPVERVVPIGEQRVEQRVKQMVKPTVDIPANVPIFERIINAPPIMNAPNPTQK
jgi:hypothetical protein